MKNNDILNIFEMDDYIDNNSIIRKDVSDEKLINEDKFYKMFNNMIKYILFHPDNRSRLIDTEEILNNTSLSYYDKLEKTKNILINIGDQYIIFDNNYDNDISNNIENVMRISSLKKGTFPKNNLVNNKDNKSLYYYKVADEIIRQMKKDIFYKLPDSYLSIDISNYKINEDEVLIFESLLNKVILILSKIQKEKIYFLILHMILHIQL